MLIGINPVKFVQVLFFVYLFKDLKTNYQAFMQTIFAFRTG